MLLRLLCILQAFSFIGLGTQPPAADWGVMLSDSKQFISTAPLMMIWPGLSIMLVVFSLNMFGEGLNEALMPGGNKKRNNWEMENKMVQNYKK